MKDGEFLKDDTLRHRIWIFIMVGISTFIMIYQATSENFRIQKSSDSLPFDIKGSVEVFESPEFGNYADFNADEPVFTANSLEEFYDCETLNWAKPMTIVLHLDRHESFPVNTDFLFYLDRLGARIYINKRMVYDSAIKYPSSYYLLNRHIYWSCFSSPGITDKDNIDVVLVTQSKYMIKKAIQTTIGSCQISTEPFILNSHTFRSILLILLAICGIVLGAMTIIMYLLFRSSNIKIPQLFYFGSLVVSCGLGYVVDFGVNNFFLNMSSFYRTLEFSEHILVAGFFSMYLQSFLTSYRTKMVRISASILITLLPVLLLAQQFYNFDLYSITDHVQIICLLNIVLTAGAIIFDAKCEKYQPADRISTPSTIIALCYILDMFTYSSSYIPDAIFSRIGILYFVITQCRELLDYLVVIIQRTAEAKYYRELAYKDSLTHVANRTSWLERLKKIESDRVTIDSYGVILFDLNNLKKVNDHMGHQSGDQFISSACKIICNVFNDCEVYRIGGDEFIALLRNYSVYECDRKLMEFETICGKWNWEHQEALFEMSVAAGGAVFDFSVDNSFEETVARADAFMYQCKLEMKGDDVR
ncbi:MAG: GGDEF domain-containing protein [Treponema sp.]|nr:GGDEF domain-containing protein [Treponema sp.]